MIGSTFSRRVVQLRQVRNFSIKETRAKYYTNPAVGAENPTYLKQGTEDKVTTGLALGGLALGILCIGRGLYNMAYGINKVA